MNRTPSRPARRGLTFIELMFATVILGVGLIMIASVFPVAINEQRAMIDESTVGNLERSACRTLDAAVTLKNPPPKINTSWLPATGTGTGLDVAVQSFGAFNPLWDRIRGDLVNKADARYAWTALYARDADLPNLPDDVTFFVVSLVSRSSAAFDGTTVASLAALKPSKVKITYHYYDANNLGLRDPKITIPPEEDTITIEDADPRGAEAAVEGAFVIRGEKLGPVASVTYPQNAIVKLGSEYTDDEITGPDGKRRFRIQGGFTLLPNDVPAANVDGKIAWVVGRDNTLPLSDPNASKANQAIACRAVTVKVQHPG